MKKPYTFTVSQAKAGLVAKLTVTALSISHSDLEEAFHKCCHAEGYSPTDRPLFSVQTSLVLGVPEIGEAAGYVVKET